MVGALGSEREKQASAEGKKRRDFPTSTWAQFTVENTGDNVPRNYTIFPARSPIARSRLNGTTILMLYIVPLFYLRSYLWTSSEVFGIPFSRLNLLDETLVSRRTRVKNRTVCSLTAPSHTSQFLYCHRSYTTSDLLSHRRSVFQEANEFPLACRVMTRKTLAVYLVNCR